MNLNRPQRQMLRTVYFVANEKTFIFLSKEVKNLDILEVSVPKLETFKKRVVGPFTFRQFVVFGVAGVMDVIIMSCFGWQVFTELSYLLLLAIPNCAIFAFLFEPFPGIKMEKYLAMFIRYNMLSPRVRTLQPVSSVSKNNKAVKSVPLKKKEIADHSEYKLYK